MKGEIIDLFKVISDVGNIDFRVVIEFKEKPELTLGDVELKQ